MEKIYAGNYIHEIKGDYERFICKIEGPGGLLGIHISDNLNNSDFYYVAKDYLGSVLALISTTGEIVESYNYDAWGRSRNPQTWEYYENEPPKIVDFGYTGHEHLNELGLINMKNRIYDPRLASFLSPDPFLQLDKGVEGLNRYSYAFNNPFKYADPDGRYAHIIMGAIIGGTANMMMNGGGTFKGQMKAFAIGAAAGGLAAGVGAGIGAVAQGTSSFGSAFIGGATLKGASLAVAGAGMGLTNGLILGTGNTLLKGQSFEDALKVGVESGLKNMAYGAVAGGIGAIETNKVWQYLLYRNIVNNLDALVGQDTYRLSAGPIAYDFKSKNAKKNFQFIGNLKNSTGWDQLEMIHETFGIIMRMDNPYITRPTIRRTFCNGKPCGFRFGKKTHFNVIKNLQEKIQPIYEISSKAFGTNSIVRQFESENMKQVLLYQAYLFSILQ